MKIINDIGLPDVLYRAILNDPYSKGDSDISVTELIAPAWMKRLERAHRDDEREVSVGEYLWMLYGKAMHYVIEKGAKKGEFTEERVFLTTPNGVLSGQFDLIEPITKGEKPLSRLTDLKVTSVYSVKDMMKNGVKPEYEAQLNLLAFIINSDKNYTERYGSIDKLRITAISRDWQPRGAKDIGYPTKVFSFNVSVWKPEKTYEYISDQIWAHLGGGEIPPCTDEERWATVDKWAVMKGGRKSAIKLHDSMEEAEEHMFKLEMIRREDPNSKPATKYYVELRRGDKTKRCDGYCSVNYCCSYYKELKND